MHNLYAKTEILNLLDETGCKLEVEQVVKFFSDVMMPIRIRYLIEQLWNWHMINLETDTITNIQYISAIGTNKELKDYEQEKYRLAFWVVAALKSKTVESCWSSSRLPIAFHVFYYPKSQLALPEGERITQEMQLDVIKTENDIAMAHRLDQLSRNITMEDKTVHMAVCEHMEDIEKYKISLIQYGYHGAVTVDYQTNKPTYVRFMDRNGQFT